VPDEPIIARPPRPSSRLDGRAHPPRPRPSPATASRVRRPSGAS